MTRAWTTPADIAAKVRRRWDDGTLLREFASDRPFPVVEVPVRGPKPAEIGDDLAAVQQWVAELEAGSRDGRRYELICTAIGGRHFGRNLLPTRARVACYEQAWALLGVSPQVSRFRQILDLTKPVAHVHAWVGANPLRALAFEGEWERAVSAFCWLDAARGSGRYLREITAPGVDTKFVERHRVMLAELLGVSRSSSGFVAGLGLRAKPDSLRLRFAQGTCGMPAPLSEGTFRVPELAALPVAVSRALVVENEITYLSVPVPEGGVVLWGKGFEVDRVGALPWLRAADVVYWGDLDTHGFAILDQLRAWLPEARSVLMDRQTLLAHQDRWVRDPAPGHARLARLTPPEAELYDDLVTDRLGESVRLEQERIAWQWVQERLSDQSRSRGDGDYRSYDRPHRLAPQPPPDGGGPGVDAR